MAYKQKSNGLPFKQMGSTPAKQEDKSDLTSHLANIITNKTAGRVKSGQSEYYAFDTGLDEYSGKKKTSPPMEPSMTTNKADRLIEIDSDKDNLEEGEKKVNKVSIAKQIEVDENRYPKPNFEIHSYEVDLSKKSGFGPSTAFGGSKNSELVKNKKVKTKKVMKDGVKQQVHGAGNTGNWQPHQFKK